MGTHQPAIWMGDCGCVTFMPEVDPIKATEAELKLPFSHSKKTATPYYYSLAMDAGSLRTSKGTGHPGIFPPAGQLTSYLGGKAFRVKLEYHNIT